MKFVVLVLLVAGVYGCGSPTYQPVVSRVVNGVDSRPHSWPWQVSLQCKIDGEWKHSCGGTMISEQWILTAAHCIIQNMECRVALGKHNLNQTETGSVFMGSANIVMHEEWNPLTLHNDIALIKLEAPVQFSDTIKTACLPSAGSTLAPNETCFITGWGRLYTGGPLADILQQALLPVVDQATCTQPDWWGSKVTERMLCAGGDGIVAGCSSDSGGPLNCLKPDGSWAVHGVVSFGSNLGCNYYEKPTVFTRVNYYMDWINSTMLAN